MILMACAALSAQDARLAQQYFQNGEYEKAAAIYERLYETNNSGSYFFDRYVTCLIEMGDYKNSEKVIKKQLKSNPSDVSLYVTFGNLYERQYEEAKAVEQYKLAVDKLPADATSIIRLGNAFINLTKYDLAIASYEKGAKLLNNDQVFAYNLGDLYRRKNDVPKMIAAYLNSMASKPDGLNTLKTILQRSLQEDDYEELQNQLYGRIQANEADVQYPELLSWVFIQRKDYKGALRQERALDRRLDENGARVFRLGSIAANDGDFDTAIEAYDYIVKQKGANAAFYIDAKQEGLRARRNKLVLGFEFSEAELRELEQQYETFLAEFGRSRATAAIMCELADLHAFYLNDLNRAVAILDEVVSYPAVEPNLLGQAKLSLADFHLMQGDRWEATLLYSQVDKAFKEGQLGNEARFRNAKLAYYTGDFQWAQKQFDVLKSSTSKLIANDALDLSVFIMDHLGLDTSEAAMQLYAEAELLVFQNRFAEAFGKMDSLARDFPEHSLQGDVVYLKGQIYLRKRQYEQAAAAYKEVAEKYSDGIRADNALFALAELYENQLSDVEQAKATYEKIFMDYSSSTFAVEARKRFRRLRGDKVQ